MKTKPTQILKEKRPFLKKKTKLECPCIRFILSILKNKKQSTTTQTTSATETHAKKDAVKQMDPEPTLKKTKRSRVMRIPKIGCTVPFLMTLFNDLTNKGVVRMDACDISKAVNTISNIKMELDGGRAWNGNIEIAKNLHLKMYKSGLVLRLKQLNNQ